jgi:hypothetical protein
MALSNEALDRVAQQSTRNLQRLISRYIEVMGEYAPGEEAMESLAAMIVMHRVLDRHLSLMAPAIGQEVEMVAEAILNKIHGGTEQRS